MSRHTGSRFGGWLAAPVRGYRRWISPALPPTCRYQPTCSEYAVEALTTRGAATGLLLTAWRLLRCAPWGGSGWDPVPPARRTLRGSAASGSVDAATPAPGPSPTIRREHLVVP